MTQITFIAVKNVALYTNLVAVAHFYAEYVVF